MSGVGRDAQTCTHDCELPIEMHTTEGRRVAGNFKAPTVNQHALPALLGLRTLVERRAILDLTRMQLAFTGPGDTTIQYSPGTDIFSLQQAPSGHLMLPCCEYTSASTGTTAAQESVSLASSSSSAAPNVSGNPQSN